MKKISISIALFSLFAFSCKKEKIEVDKSTEGLSHEDVVSLEKNSVFTNETLIYKGTFEGKYYGDKIVLKLSNNDFIIEYKGKTYEGEWFKKDDGSLLEIDPKKNKLPFQFLRWSDNSEIMILNDDGMGDDKGENYLTRIE
jgi:hypothetical protein